MDPSKLYVEYYAKLHAERAMKLWPMRFAKSDRPDFLTRHGEIGMEVTRAALEEWAQPDADMNRAFGDEMPGEAEFVDALDGRRKGGKVPVLEASQESLQKFAPAANAADAAKAAAPAVLQPPPTIYPPLESTAR